MKKRLITSIFIVLTVFLAIISKFLPFSIGEYIFDVFILLVCMIASFEMCNLMEKLNKPVNKYWASMYPLFNYIILLFSLEYLKFYLIILIEIAFLLVYFLLIWCFNALKKSEVGNTPHLKTAFNSLLVCLYPAFFFCLFLIINHSDNFAGMKFFSMIFIIMVFAITMLTDTFAYLVGSTFHGPKLAPKISPNKTISGAIGGLLGGIAGAMLVYAVVYNVADWSLLLSMYNLSWWHFMIIGLVCAFFSQCGDLFESKLKRMANIKDTSNILPGHGGMLDRIDAMIWCVTVIYIIVLILII